MTGTELLQLDPQHLAELRSFLHGFAFQHVDIVAKETVKAEPYRYEPSTTSFAVEYKSLKLDNVFRGEKSMHTIFSRGEDNIFYCISYAKIGDLEERIIFRLFI